jgi:hypothetical protein
VAVIDGILFGMTCRVLGAVVVLVGMPMCAQQKAAAPMGTVSGHVMCSDTQKPARGAQVSLVGLAPVMTKDGNSLRIAQTKTSLDGSFVVPGLAAGDYYAVVTMAGYVLPLAADEGWKPPAKPDVNKVLANVPVVHVVAERTTSVDLTMKHGGVIAGRVAFDDGSPAAGMDITVQPTKGQNALNEYLGELDEIRGEDTRILHTDDAGRYRMAGLPAGKYRVYAALETQHGATHTVGERTPESFFDEDGQARQNLFVYAPGVFKVADAKVVELNGDEVEDGVDVALRLDGLHTVRGRVLALSDRHSLSRATLFLKDDAGFDSKTEAEPDGSFHFDYIPEGTYKLFIWGRDITPGGPRGMEEENAHVYERVNTTVIVTVQDMVLDDFLLAEPKKPDAGEP